MWTVAIGRAISLCGDEAALVALSLRLQGNGRQPWTVAALFVAGLLPLVVLAGPVGRLVDRADSRHLLVTSSLLQAGICLALAFTTNNLAMLALVVALGCGEAVNGATWQALVPSIVGTEGIAAATGILQSARTAATVAAPALAGILVGAFDTRAMLLVDVATYLAITVTAMTIATRRKVEVSSEPGEMRSGWSIVRADQLLRSLLALMCTFVVLGASVVVVEVFLIRETLHASAAWYGIALAVWGAGMLAGAVAGGRYLRSATSLARVLLIGVVGLSVCMVGFALCRDIAQLIALSVVGGLANGLVNFAGTTLMTTRSAAEERGRVAAIYSGILSASLVGAYAIGGIAGIALTPREIYAIGGALGLAAPVLLGRALLRAVSGDAASQMAARSNQAA